MSREADVEALASAKDAGSPVVDVRDPQEYVAGHVPGALNIPLPELRGRLADVPRTGTVYVVCASGNRSKVGADLLSRAGVEALSVAGGTAAWRRSGRRVVTGGRP
jgi:rhodanese-related sulfurtransferase